MILDNLEQIATGQILDENFADYIKVKFFFHPESGKTIVSHKSGLYTYQTPPAVDSREALWLLRNHPTSNVKFITV